MRFTNKVFSILIIVSFLAIPEAGAKAQTALANGTLVRASGDNTVYYIDNGSRRPIDSMETFRIQGFSSAIQEISVADLVSYPTGEIITPASSLVFPGQEQVAPDIAPFAAKDIQLVTRNGRKLLLFTTQFWNRGRGPLELVATADPSKADNIETGQRIVLPNGQVRTKLVGNLFWHAIHNHFHYDNFASYVLGLVPPTTSQAPVLGVSTEIRNKSTFCIYETESVQLQAEGVKKSTKSYTTCGKFKQGISVGWADKYDYTLPDQNFDVTDLPPGIYRLAFVLDPLQYFMEGSRENNISVTFVDLNPQAGAMQVLASGSPFYTPTNFYPEGMLVRSENSPATFIIRGNKKYPVATVPSGQVFVLPPGVFNAIPSVSLIQAIGSPTIYSVNNNGFRRGITSLEVFNSYGLRFQDVVQMSEADLANYPETDLIKTADNPAIYSIKTRQAFASLEALAASGQTLAAVHTISPVDFQSYMMEEVATGLFVPWDVSFLPDGDMLVPERSGNLRRIGKNPAVFPIPSVLDTGEGGLMGVVLHPQFAQNNLIYVYYTTSENGQKNRVVRFRLVGSQLTDQTIIIDNIPSAIYHDGGRMAFGPDGMLYITTGDANSSSLAQDLGSLAGKTLRLTPDGQIPADNPFGTAVWSYGHRNSQGIAWDSFGRMWETEHGRSGASTGFDELNIIEKGKNYGWPVIQGSQTQAGMVTPVLNSGATETWAPAGITFTQGSLFFSGLLGSKLYQVRFNADGSFRDIRTHFAGQFGRLRAAVLGPDGSLYLSTSNRDGRGTVRSGDDKILRVYPGLLQSFR